MNGHITQFHVHFCNGHRVKEPIKRLFMLDWYVRTYSHHSITKIVFWIACALQDPHYPYQGRTLTLHSVERGFQCGFYYWYDRRGYRVEYSNQHKKIDFDCLLQTLAPISAFQTSLLPYLLDPCL